jgi:cytochrome P450
VGGVPIPNGSRVILLFGSANRDERKWDEAERFDVARNATDQLSFGHGPHACVGASLARLEMHAILSALAKRVTPIELLGERRRLNNVLRSFETLEVILH